MTFHDHVFREYDIRGYVGKELTDEFAYTLGRAYGTLARDSKKNNVAIGWDCRLSSEGFAKALARGISDEGIDATLTGMGPTPQLYYAVFAVSPEGRPFEGGIQVTGSHNPSDMNGFKICLGKDTLSGKEIQGLKERFRNLPSSLASQKGTIKELSVRQSYIDELIKNSKPHIGPRKLKVVVDAGNGVGGLVGPEVLSALGIDVVKLYCEPDGRFPNHHPDPTELKNIKDLVAKVKEVKADFGIGWDGDADRIGAVDENGEVIYGDMLVLIFAREILKSVPNATVIGDVKCSSLLFSDLKKRGGNPIMWKTGHSLIKHKLKETNAALAGEMSGHIFFKHRFFGFDDAMYASVRLAEIVSNTTLPVSKLLADLPKMVSTPEIRAECPEAIKFKILEKAQKAFNEFTVDPLDGVRITFDHGWAIVRASNTQPVLVMRFEADNERDLAAYQKLVTERIEKIKKDLGA